LTTIWLDALDQQDTVWLWLVSLPRMKRYQ